MEYTVREHNGKFEVVRRNTFLPPVGSDERTSGDYSVLATCMLIEVAETLRDRLNQRAVRDREQVESGQVAAHSA